MKLTVNGNETEVVEPMNVSGLLAFFNVEPTRAVVEVNGSIVDRATFDSLALANGDQVEIVRFVGGG